MSLWSKIRGTSETIFQLGLGGPQIKANAGNIEARNSSDAAFVISRAATPVGVNDLVTKAYADAGDAPFFATYYVDPNYAGGGSSGSASRPFTTIAAAFAAALAASITSGVIFVPVGTITENIVFPAAGGDWEIACTDGVGIIACALTGTIDMTGGGTRALTNLSTYGVISGNAASGIFNRAIFTNCFMQATVTLTVTGGAVWRASFVGTYPGGKQLSGSQSAAVVTVAGTVTSSFWRFIVAPVFNSTSEFFSTEFDAGFTSNGAGAVTAILTDCIQQGAGVLTASSGSLVVLFDNASAASFARAGTTISGTVNQYVNQPTSSRQTLSGNLAAANLTGGRYPKSMMTVTVCMTLLVAGTAGTLQAAVLYTDLNGTLQTVNVGGGLLITSPAGTEVTGTLTFSQNGATAVQIKTTGVVTPGALSYSLAFSEQIAA